MLTGNLFDRMLLEPARGGANKLYVVSGYATPAMAFHHVETLRNSGIDIEVELIIGMCAREGLGLSHHAGFMDLMDSSLSGRFKCSYLTAQTPVHSKAYAWYNDDTPVAGFVGSANYTQMAFGNNQRELNVPCSAEECLAYFNSLIGETIYCNHPDAENQIVVFNDRDYAARQRMVRLTPDAVRPSEEQVPEGLPRVTINLLDNRGDLPQSSGLNWGQRPEYRREPNQAYIRVPRPIAVRGFFPPRAQHFTVLKDDGKTLVCTIAQAQDKAIETPHNNSLIGLYFRNRLGLPNGARVQKEDLLRYGRTDVDFYKIDNETYYMDFSPPANP